jgi:hypothetical protein
MEAPIMTITRRQAVAAGVTLAAGVVSQADKLPARPLLSTHHLPEEGHVVLLGDSIFDNQPYVAPNEATIDFVRKILPNRWQATLLAKDGATVLDIGGQQNQMDLKDKFVFLSIGGNDALKASGILNQPATNSSEVFAKLADIQQAFFGSYCKMLEGVLAVGGKTTLCTIYDPNFPDQRFQRLAKAGLTIYNDCILRAGCKYGLPLIDLRIAFNDRKFYANPIEPSAEGSQKLAELIWRVIKENDFQKKESRLLA